jgi:hypothetical protein
MDLVQELLKSAEEYDRKASEATVQKLVTQVRSTGELLDRRPLSRALTALRNNRWFDILRSAGDGIMQAGDDRSFVRRLYAQALIDSGAVSAAIPFLQSLIAESDDAGERTDARGILGRAWKQAYVNGEHITPQRGKVLLETAVTSYYTPYVENPANYYHGINAVACLARAKHDKLLLSGNFPDWIELARTIRNDIDAAEYLPYWDYATAMEASWALRDQQAALKWLDKYLAHPETSAFAVASTLRQLIEVWKVSPGDDEGGALIHVLQSALLKKQGGESLDMHAQSVSADQLRDPKLQAILGDERYKSLEWYERGLKRSRAVARIGRQASVGFGTGFLVNASDLDPAETGQLLITNHHVIPQAIPDIQNAVVIFEALDGGKKKYAIEEMLWTSPVEELDATVLRLKTEVKKIDPYPMCVPPLPDVKEKPHVYVIGHPGGGTMSFSISDNLMIDHKDPKVHYRTPTSPGSSGSPVFDSEWVLLALHHSGTRDTMPMLHGDGVYSANEGLYFPTIKKQFQARRK